MDVDDLKRRVLQQLLVHPQLVGEFFDALTEEHAPGDALADREIIEVSNAALGQTAGAASALSHGALMELLTESPYAAEYRALAAQEMELETDVETARQILGEAFGKLRLRRLERVRTECLQAYQHESSPAALEAYRAADQAYLRARAEALDEPRPVNLSAQGNFFPAPRYISAILLNFQRFRSRPGKFPAARDTNRWAPRRSREDRWRVWQFIVQRKPDLARSIDSTPVRRGIAVPYAHCDAVSICDGRSSPECDPAVEKTQVNPMMSLCRCNPPMRAQRICTDEQQCDRQTRANARGRREPDRVNRW